MKKYLFIFILFIGSCDGDDFSNPQRQFDYGTITALKNGVPWSAVIHGADGDVNCDVYRVVRELPHENHIEITEYNSSTKEFRGKFSVTFAIDEDRTRCNPNAQDTIRFTNGQFHSKITR